MNWPRLALVILAWTAIGTIAGLIIDNREMKEPDPYAKRPKELSLRMAR
jgi:hypothetical protein